MQGRGGGGGGLMVNQAGAKKVRMMRPPEEPLRCPRCDSFNTKFCYYNNYSLAQPRHFCKTCRRYWTKGGALRSVPVGAGCRKNKRSGKKAPTCSSPTSQRSITEEDTMTQLPGRTNSRICCSFSSSSSLIQPSGTLISGNTLKLFHGLSSPSMDFHLSGLPFSRPQPSDINQFSSFGELSSVFCSSAGVNFSEFVLPLAGASSRVDSRFGGVNSSEFVSPLAGASRHVDSKLGGGFFCGLGSQQNMHSTVNAEIHSKLAMLLVEGQQQKETVSMGVSAPAVETHHGVDQQYQQLQRPCAEIPNYLKTDGFCSLASSSDRRRTLVECGKPRETTNEWVFGGFTSWPDLQQYSSLP